MPNNGNNLFNKNRFIEIIRNHFVSCLTHNGAFSNLKRLCDGFGTEEHKRREQSGVILRKNQHCVYFKAGNKVY